MIIAGSTFLFLALVFVWIAHSGDNSDARALAGIFYIPAIACGATGAVFLLLSLV